MSIFTITFLPVLMRYCDVGEKHIDNLFSVECLDCICAFKRYRSCRNIINSEPHHDAESLHISYCDLTFGSAKQDEPGCCEPGGTCFEKQCCSHGHASGTAVVETQPRSYEAPFRDEMAVSKAALYTSADMRSHYRPPIA